VLGKRSISNIRGRAIVGIAAKKLSEKVKIETYWGQSESKLLFGGVVGAEEDRVLETLEN
jgi:hypothetical protein